MILADIHSPEDLKLIPKKLLPKLTEEIRSEIIRVVGKNGGHLASNLGAVELTIALHRIFSSPSDAIVWDVGHQCYTHKLLTGRYKTFNSIRTKGGLSGFMRRNESMHDYFDTGHASSSISSALGLLSAWELQGRKDKVVAVIGDGALTGGMAFEGLCHAGQLAKNLIVVVNDNQMSIDRNVGSFSKHLSRLAFTGFYHGFRFNVDRLIDKIPYFSRHIGKLVFRVKRGLKGLFFTNNFFVDLGFEYVGPLNGHDIDEMERVFIKAKKIPRPVVIHVVTKKGKGYSPAENSPDVFHGVGPFNTSAGLVEKFDSQSFTEHFSRKIVCMAEKDSRIVAVTAAMSKGTGLDVFSRKFPSRFFDVGIAEEHAVTFAGGLASGGLVPIVAIYSTFIQRSVDQIIEDIALQSRHVVIVLDRSGAVPSDGETHQGIFDIALFRPIPDLMLLSVSGESDMDLCLEWAIEKAECPVVIRWPKLSCPSEVRSFSLPIEVGKGLLVSGIDIAPTLAKETSCPIESEQGKVLIVCTGSMFSESLVATRALVLEGIETDIYSLRFIKPIDTEYFTKLASGYSAIVFVEDGVKTGGVSVFLESLVKESNRVDLKPSSEYFKTKTCVLAFPDSFVSNGNREEILCEVGLSPENIAKSAKELLIK